MQELRGGRVTAAAGNGLDGSGRLLEGLRGSRATGRRGRHPFLRVEGQTAQRPSCDDNAIEGRRGHDDEVDRRSVERWRAAQVAIELRAMTPQPHLPHPSHQPNGHGSRVRANIERPSTLRHVSELARSCYRTLHSPSNHHRRQWTHRCLRIRAYIAPQSPSITRPWLRPATPPSSPHRRGCPARRQCRPLQRLRLLPRPLPPRPPPLSPP